MPVEPFGKPNRAPERLAATAAVAPAAPPADIAPLSEIRDLLKARS